MEEIKIIKRPKLRNPTLIAAWPGMGEVAFKSASYLIDRLKAEEFAQIPPQGFFYLTESMVKSGIISVSGLPQNRFYYYKDKAGKSDLIIFLSDAQPDLAKAEEYCKRILGVAKSFKTKLIISMAAMPQPIDHSQQPNVWLAATSEALLKKLTKSGAQTLNEGQVSGLNGLFLGIAKREGFEGVCLLGEIPLYTIQIENPRASQAVLGVLCRIINLRVDFSVLKEQAQTLEGQINSLLDYLKLGPTTPGPIGEEEIEKIKKSLSQLTKLPASIKEKIEQLFIDAQNDISKANELKAELDKWNVYKEYEDRFLDLFKKGKDNN